MNPHNIAHVSNIRRENVPLIATWIIYYAWVIVFTTWWSASALDGKLFNTDIRILLHALNLVAAAVSVLLITKANASSVTRAASVLLAVSCSLFFLSSGSLHAGMLVLFGAAMGTLNSSILIPFVFRLNNSEKFYAVIGANLLISVLLFLREVRIFDITAGSTGALIMLAAGLLPVFRSGSRIPEETPGVPRTASVRVFTLTILLNCLYVLFCKSLGKVFLMLADSRTPLNLSMEYYLGALLGCALYYLIYAAAAAAGHLSWNITFGSFVIALLLYASAPENMAVLMLSAALLGVSSVMGMISMYYILGVIGKKYDSIRYVRFSVIIIGLAGGLAAVLLGRLAAASGERFSTLIAFISAAAAVILLVLSPRLSRTYFISNWSDDSQKPEIDNDRNYMFAKYGLSRRETELCRLFLEGYTMRQIAGMLGLSYATVNTYQTSLYRKLNINSRTELILLFREYLSR
jgi:DNA-binding CsgD family transcriptional regulator